MDRRVRKTRESLKSSLIALLKEQDFKTLTVHDITAKADVNRGTFYHHYYDKYDLLEKTIEEMTEKLKDSVSTDQNEFMFEIAPNPNEAKTGQVTNKPFVRLFKHIKEEKPFYESMFGANIFHFFYPRFIEVLYSYFEVGFERSLNKNAVNVDKKLMIHYVLFANLGVLRCWIRDGMKESPEYMGEQLKRLLMMTPFEFREQPVAKKN